jgi:hypothetical protein
MQPVLFPQPVAVGLCVALALRVGVPKIAPLTA